VLDRGVPRHSPNGTFLGYVGGAIDIHDRRRAEEQLRTANARLAEGDRRKNEFLAMLAHELRNPLAPIRYSLEVLKLKSPNDGMLQRQREMIDRQVGHMCRLLDDLLEVSRITRGKIQLKKERLDLRQSIEQAVEALRPDAEARRQTLEMSLGGEPLWVQGDFTRLVQVFSNLLNNAIKYTEAGGRIEVSLAQLDGKDESGVAVARVRDTGMGIAPEALPHVFELFAQAERTLDRSQGGLGIGLTLVQRLVQMHGGITVAHSQGIGKGSEFIVQLPLVRSFAAAESAAFDASFGSLPATGRKVLVVEDNADSAQSLKELLQWWGYEVRTAYDGREALDTAARFLPEVVLLDIGLPVLNGYEVARFMKDHPDMRCARLVALTGYGQEEDRQRSAEVGFDAHLTKPVDLEALRGILNQSS
jgi:signal transduction histidine kinase/CheY-like chemotaxis protein